MSISIIKPGLLDTIQDMGRFGYGNWGINAGGVMDRYAAMVGAALVGNCFTEAVMEIHFPGPQILFEQNALISITGADFSATVNDELLPLWQPVVVRKNTLLHFPRLVSGSRCYLHVHGGFHIEKWLDSYSTNLKAGAGGYGGRAFKKGDELCFKDNRIYFSGLLKEQDNMRSLPWRADIKKIYQWPKEIHVIPGNEWKSLKADAQKKFISNEFIVHPASDRMGYQLKGENMEQADTTEIISSGVSFGTIQLLPNGQLIVLMADHQTTGGYPRVGHIISAHLHKLAQLRPGESVKFALTSIQEAEELLAAQQKELHILQQACTDHLNTWYADY